MPSDFPSADIISIQSSELDFLTLMEGDIPPPIAFRDIAALEEWVQQNQLRMKSLGRRNKNNVMLIEGKVFLFDPISDPGLLYSQLWVNIDYEYYRDAVKFHLKTIDKKECDISMRDADHAVGRERIKEVWPNAWINLLLVERGINRSVGAMMEKMALSPEGKKITVNAEAILKIFYEKKGTLKKENIREYLTESRKKFLTMSNVKRNANQINSSDFNKIQSIFLDQAAHCNATAFFDDFTRELGIDPIEYPDPPMIIISHD